MTGSEIITAARVDTFRPLRVQSRDAEKANMMAMPSTLEPRPSGLFRVSAACMALCMSYLFYVQMMAHESLAGGGLLGFGKALIVLSCMAIIVIMVHMERVRVDAAVVLASSWILLMLANSIVVTRLDGTELLLSACSSMVSALVFFAYYSMTKGHPERMPFVVASIILIAVMVFYVSSSIAMALARRKGEYGQQTSVYYLLLLLPWVGMLRKRWLRNGLVILIGGAILFSLKRTAIVAGGLCLFAWSMYFMRRDRRMSFGLKSLSFVTLISLFAFGAWGMNQALDNRILWRMSVSIEDKGSGRLELYSETLRMIARSDPPEILFGHGHHAVEQHTRSKLSAHNDFLEIAFDYGLVGMLVYLSIHGALLFGMMALFRQKDPYAPILMSSWIIFTTMSFVSHLIIYPSYFCLFAALWGSIFGSKKSILA
jgi:O-antigen ligase